MRRSTGGLPPCNRITAAPRPDAATLPRLVDALRARGYGFVTLDAMLG